MMKLSRDESPMRDSNDELIWLWNRHEYFLNFEFKKPIRIAPASSSDDKNRNTMGGDDAGIFFVATDGNYGNRERCLRSRILTYHFLW
mmetsp:Transcript_25364/g.59389  ORF Transcript_25364/g.59389 Transcript_25364/m.59389 type:complete len:88 (-) Transcript_25364:81-344(-)